MELVRMKIEDLIIPEWYPLQLWNMSDNKP